MFEVSGSDVANLGDADLRRLVMQLSLAELSAQGCPLSAVIAGGNQDAPDGGLDVRIECPIALSNPDFVPRQLTGFQVKKPDMPASAICEEMRPSNELRDVIRELAEVSGAYIIVSAQGSVADKPLRERRQAIRNALHDLPTASQLHTDFYDRDRLAIWINKYPGVSAWVRSHVGRPLSGWSSVTDWGITGEAVPKPYLFNDKACLVDERSRERKQLTILDGITHLRTALRIPRQCIRLVGLSGLGKTRLVQALFESGVGEDPLDPSLAIYTDYSEGTDPTAHDMARQLIERGQFAILIVDNCNPSTHTELARICSGSASSISLITVEYDVRDDEPERTEVFLLQSSSPELVAEWLKLSFPDISQLDRDKIAEFSDGNFRIARALAETLGKGETLGRLKSHELFQRIFQQRNEPDQHLLRMAEDLSLLYSIDGEDTSKNSELSLVGTIRNVASSSLYGALVELRRRGIVQARGRWRAILPQAIANPLASSALERIPPSDFDRFCLTLTPRMLTSVSRRLSFLHDSCETKALVTRWLCTNGPLGDLIALGEPGLQIVTNLAPVAPDVVLAKLEEVLNSPTADLILEPNAANRMQWIRLIRVLGYDAHMFTTATMLLVRFLVAEPEGNVNKPAYDAFSELFHRLLSGTKATPEQRRQVIKTLALSGVPTLQRCASVALDAILKTHYFFSMSSYDFGARSRDWGWQPKIHQEVWDWYSAAIELAVELEPNLVDVRNILARHVRELWLFDACHDALERAAMIFVKERPWIDGWLAFRAAHRFDGKGMPEEIRLKLEHIIQHLKPSDLLHQARAVVINRANGGWDVADVELDDNDAMRSWEKASLMAQDVGRSLAHDAVVRKEFMGELLVEPHQLRAFECGHGLAEGADDLGEIWREIISDYSIADPTLRNATVLGGFIYGANSRDKTFASSALEDAINDPSLVPVIPYLQGRVGIDEEGIARLRRAIAKGVLSSSNFYSIANGVVKDSPPDHLADLLEDIGALPEGVEIALDILHMYFFQDGKDDRIHCHRLIEVGRNLLVRADFSKKGVLRDFGMHTVIRMCLAGNEAGDTARQVCINILSASESVYISSHDLSYILKALFETQPFIALDTFLLPQPPLRNHHLFDADFGVGTPIEEMDFKILRQWADIDSVLRYPLLGRCISMFGKKNDGEEMEFSSLFLTMLDHAPDKRRFLGNFWDRLHPRSWSGSLANILVRRKAQVIKLAEHSDEDVKGWVADTMPELYRWIENESRRDREREESFE
ncbi:MAG: hypothetical protein WCH05_10600 [Chlorobiaceae bacterium]